jgi:hypothetical protein
MGGGRDEARKLCSHLPADRSATDVRVDASMTEMATYMFAEELVNQILTVRNAKILTVYYAPEGLYSHMTAAAGRKNLSKRLIFLPEQGA